MNALLIEFDAHTGIRAGRINPKDPKLQCHGWQDLESTPAKEIRVIKDDRELSQYEGIEGVTILQGRVEINQAISSICKPRYTVENEILFQEHLRQKSIKLSDYKGKSSREILKDLMESKKIIGIRKILARQL